MYLISNSCNQHTFCHLSNKQARYSHSLNKVNNTNYTILTYIISQYLSIWLVCVNQPVRKHKNICFFLVYKTNICINSDMQIITSSSLNYQKKGSKSHNFLPQKLSSSIFIFKTPQNSLLINPSFSPSLTHLYITLV